MNTPKNTKRASTLNGPAPAPTNKRKAPKSSVEPTRSPTADEWGIPANKRKAPQPAAKAAPRNTRTASKLIADLRVCCNQQIASMAAEGRPSYDYEGVIKTLGGLERLSSDLGKGGFRFVVNSKYEYGFNVEAALSWAGPKRESLSADYQTLLNA